MLPYKQLEKIARFTVESMRIGRKPNKSIKKAMKKFGKKVDRILKLNEFTPKQLSAEEKKLIEKLKDPDYGPLIVEEDGRYKVKKEVGQTVLLVYSTADKECEKLAQLIKEECWRRGAHVTAITYSSEESRKHLQLIPFDTATELPEVSKLFAGEYDARIFLGGEENINWAKGLEKKLKVGALASQKLKQIIDKKKVKWCYFGWPIAKRNQTYRKIFYESIKETFSPQTKKICKYYESALKNGDKVKIVADDTELEFSIKGRPILVADGVIDEEDVEKGDVGLNIPDGEVFVAPLENSANGRITFDFVCIHGFGLVKNLKVRFENGKVVWFDSPQKKIFKKFLEANSGEKDRIAEFGIGCNPKAKFVGETIVDEKIFGSIHIAIGSNTGAYHGKNRASSHQDMIKIMKGKGGKVYIDDKLIMEDGLPVKFKY